MIGAHGWELERDRFGGENARRVGDDVRCFVGDDDEGAPVLHVEIDSYGVTIPLAVIMKLARNARIIP